jgi:type 1 glutamine amidotransferase
MKIYLFALVAGLALAADGADKRVVFIAGKPSHRPGHHEHRAGCLLLQSCLAAVPGVTSVVYSNGWPVDPEALAGADAIVLYADGGAGHPLLQGDRLKTVGALMDRGVGLVLLHYAVEPTIERGQREFTAWAGGAFEIHWSVNPVWEAAFEKLPAHPVARGIQSFTLRDEWYFNMRFVPELEGVTPILSAVPPASTTNRVDGPHENNPFVRQMVARGELQHVAWAFARPNGGRGFATTGGHYHENWGNDQFRKAVLNGILWTAQMDVPAGGVPSRVTPEQLAANLDDKTDRRR